MARNSFCARPGCGIARSMHGKLANACGTFIEARSKEATVVKPSYVNSMASDAAIATLRDAIANIECAILALEVIS